MAAINNGPTIVMIIKDFFFTLDKYSREMIKEILFIIINSICVKKI
jgi:hypothetical protein